MASIGVMDAITTVSAALSSEPLQRGVSGPRLRVLQARVLTAQALAESAERGPRPHERLAAEAYRDLAYECLQLMAGTDDEADAFLQEPVAGLAYEVSMTELAANGIATFVLGLQSGGEVHMDLIQSISAELDVLAVYIFRGLRLLAAEGCLLVGHKGRLQRALQGICAWTVAAVALAVGMHRFSGDVLWQWASADAAWALVLAKGILSISQPGDINVLVPDNLLELQRAVMRATLELASPVVAFSAESDGDVAMVVRAAELSCHHTELAAAAIECQILEVLLVSLSTGVGPDAGPGFAAFLVSMLQVDIAEEQPDWAAAAGEVGITAVRLARQGGAALAGGLQNYSELVWHFLAETLEGCAVGNVLPHGFLQDCASLAFLVPLSERGLHSFVGKCLACPDAVQVGQLPDVIAVLCILWANCYHQPSGVLLQTLMTLPQEARSNIVVRWQRWRGPVRKAWLGQWIALGCVASLVESQPASVAELELSSSTNLPQPAPLPTSLPEPTCQTGLRKMFSEVPDEFRCALDGHLLLDPVRTPQGYICERATLADMLNDMDCCPITMAPLHLGQCARLPELRRQVLQWVRSRRPAGKAMPGVT